MRYARSMAVLLLAFASILGAGAMASTPAEAAASPFEAQDARGPLPGKTPACGGSAFLAVPYGFAQIGANVVIVTVGTASIVYQETWLDSPAPCPGPPASISIFASDTTTCGSSEALTIEVVDAGGFNVKDETLVSVTSSVGMALSSRTRGGLAVTSLLLSPKTSGVAEITVVAGGVAARTSIQVSCG